TLALLDGDVVAGAGSLQPVDGYLPVSRTRPVTDATLLDTVAAPGQESERWWRARLLRVRAELSRSRWA
ncbi:MAG: O-succinylbenzoate synthase, partial [Pseudonocardiaceae bacterium]